VSEIVVQLEKVAYGVVDSVSKIAQASRALKIRRHYPFLRDEALLFDTSCKLFCKSGTYKGHLTYTTRHFIFFGDDSKGVEFVVPFTDVVSLQRIVHSKDPGEFSITTEERSFVGIQVFVSVQNLLLTFAEFHTPRGLRATFSEFDKLWRMCATVPNPSVEYIDPMEFHQPLLRPDPEVRVLPRNMRDLDGNIHSDRVSPRECGRFCA